MMARKRYAGVSIGTFCAVPFLLGLLAYASVVFVASFAVTSAQPAVAQGPRWGDVQRQALTCEAAALREEIKRLRLLLPRDAADVPDGATAALQRAQAAASRDELRRRLAQCEQELSVLEDKQSRLRALTRQMDEARRSKEQLDTASQELTEEIARLEAQTAELQARSAALDGAVGKARITAGAPRKTIYVECEVGGATIMPDNIVLGAFPDPVEQDRLLEQASAQGCVVFLVRPDGFQTFDTYRRIVEERSATTPDTSIELGWEPVDADWHLKYIPLDDCTLVTYEED